MNARDDFRKVRASSPVVDREQGQRLVARALARARGSIRRGNRGIPGLRSRRAIEADLWATAKAFRESLEAPQSIPRLRLAIMNTLEALAKVDVLLIAPPSPFLGVSGELIAYIDYIGRVDREFCDYLRHPPPWPSTFDDFVAKGLRKHFRLGLLATFLNDLRSGLEPVDDDPLGDWLAPYYIAMCIQSEMTYRRYIRAPDFTFDPLDFEMIEAANRLRIDVAGPSPEFRLRSGRSWRERVRWRVTLTLADRRGEVGDGDGRRRIERGFSFPFFYPPGVS